MPADIDPMVPTSSQTVGPFFDIGLTHLQRDCVIDAGAGEAIVSLRGSVRDGNGDIVPDVEIEIWQAATDGSFDAGGARGFARVYPDATGGFEVRTVIPGVVPGPGASRQAPHLSVLLFMRGLLKPLWTRMYFPDDPANDADPVLALVPADRRHTMIARRDAERSLRWDVILQGENETVFFEW